MSNLCLGGGESLKVDVPPGFGGAFGLFSSPTIEQPPEVIKAEPDTEQLLKGKFYESENDESDDASSEELEDKEEDDPFFREEDDDYAPLRPKPKRRKKRKGAFTYEYDVSNVVHNQYRQNHGRNQVEITRILSVE